MDIINLKKNLFSNGIESTSSPTSAPVNTPTQQTSTAAYSQIRPNSAI